MKFVLASSLLFVAVHCSNLGIKVVKHQPCHTPDASLVFPNSDTAPVVEDNSGGEKCYKMGGTIKVGKEIKGSLNVYVETKNGTTAEPVDCRNPDKDGCGGIGSCVYCDACNSLKEATKNSIEVLVDNKKVECNTGLKVGTYDNVYIHFCPPPLEDFLKSQNIDRKAWDDLIGNRGTTIYMTVHIYDKQINSLSKAQLQQLVKSGDGEIGCHKLIVNMFNVN